MARRSLNGSWLKAALFSAMATAVIVATLLTASHSPTKPNSLTPAARAEALKKFSSMPLYFERNVGQTDPSVRYLSRTSRYSLYLTDDATVISIVGGTIHKGQQIATQPPLPPDKLIESNLKIRLVGANPHPGFEALESLPGHVNYLIGNDPSKYRRNVPIFARVKMKNAYPGIDLVYYGTGKSLEYDLIAAPGADTSKLKFAVEGSAKTSVDKDGNLEVEVRRRRVGQNLRRQGR